MKIKQSTIWSIVVILTIVVCAIIGHWVYPSTAASIPNPGKELLFGLSLIWCAIALWIYLGYACGLSENKVVYALTLTKE